ncbi:MlaE family ABC transporter permease [Aquihabitans daechungensis]|uniref:MlaE family ABC transporter permease n=1 Tax=Aquihabitans daechungensis TaxID=1052257 RepID=UPI003BA0F85A
MVAPASAPTRSSGSRALAPVGRAVSGAGSAIIGGFAQIHDQVVFAGRIIRRLPQALKYRKEILLLISDMTIGAGALVVGGGMIFVIFFLSFFTGTEVGLQGFTALQQIGAESFSGVISSVANTREITPLIAGVALAAQVGAGFTAQLGAMRISDEVDALEVMSVDSFVYLVCTRVWAALITMVPLYLTALFASYLATELIVTRFFTLSPGVYRHYFRLFLPPIDIVYSFIKAMVFAMVVALVHCYYGYYATGGPAGVGKAAGRAIRMSIILVTLLNLLMSLVFWGGKDTARIVGSIGIGGIT